MAGRQRPRDRHDHLTTMLRSRIIAGLHSGQYDAGDRLPTYREVSSEAGTDLRAVARAYGVLEREGLVEVRGRSGVFVAPQERIGGTVLAETSRWLAAVLREARLRRVPIPEFPEFARRCTQSTTVRCVCIESTEDQVSALCRELETEFGFGAHGMLVDSLSEAAAHPDDAPVPTAIAAADLVVTTLYHAAAITPVARRWNRPLVVVRLCPDAIRQVQECVEAHELPVIHVDPRFVDRLRAVLGARAERIRPISARDRKAVAALDPDRPALISAAARGLLKGVRLPPPAISGGIVSNESAGELIDLLIRFNLEAIRSREGEATREGDCGG
jgi:DNA-binding transcriptional regulator YhcF (GntR family)